MGCCYWQTKHSVNLLRAAVIIYSLTIWFYLILLAVFLITAGPPYVEVSSCILVGCLHIVSHTQKQLVLKTHVYLVSAFAIGTYLLLIHFHILIPPRVAPDGRASTRQSLLAAFSPRQL